jgi:putative DNA primase/helicase
LLAADADRLRYCPPWRKWLVWDGRRWAEDAGDCRARARARRVVRKMARDAAALMQTDPKGADALFAWAVKCETAGRGPAMLEWARTIESLWVTPDDLDADDYLLNCANGTVDLRTGALRPHEPADLLTQLAPVVYDSGAPAPRWEQAVGEILGDAELAAFVRRLVGLSLTGDVRDHLLPVAWGATGRNGKGLLLNTLVAALGDYATPLPADELMVSRGERHPTGQALLYRKRLVVASETEGGRRLAVAKVKELTGGDPIPARRMREDYWTFRPTHTIWLVTNDKPEIAETKNAIWDRVKCIPFETYFRDPAKAGEAPRGAPKRVLDKDPDLYRKVAEELPGVLAWAVRGCLEWQREGLNEPAAVAAATADYRDDMDVLARFLDDRCEVAPQLSEEATKLYVAYKGWCELTGERAESQRRFGERLGERGHVEGAKHPVTRRTTRTGLKLCPLPDEDGSAPPPSTGGRS